jgi:hypothetical protein
MGLRDYMNRSKSGSNSQQRAEERAMEAAGINPAAASIESSFAQSIANQILSGDPAKRAMYAGELQEWGSDPEMASRYLAALRLVDQQSPGLASEIVQMAGSPEAFNAEFPPIARQEDSTQVSEGGGKRKAPNKISKDYSKTELFSTFGAGKDNRVLDEETGQRISGGTQPSLGQIVDNALETRSNKELNETYKGKDYRKRNEIFAANPQIARAIREEQLRILSEKPLAPEHVAMLSSKQVSQITGVPLDQVDGSLTESLIGKPIPPEIALKVLTRGQMDGMTGIKSTDLSILQSRPDLAESIAAASARQAESLDGKKITSDYASERQSGMSTRDQVMAAVRSAASSGGTVQLDATPGLRVARYGFPASQNQEIVRPELAPSGEFLASLFRPLYDPSKTDGTFMPTWTPVLDRSIREQASSLPATQAFPGRPNVGGQTAKFYADLMLEPARGGAYLKAAERDGSWRFPQFMDGVWMNRGQPKPSLDLGGLLIDEIQSAPQPGSTISTQEQSAPMPTVQPQITPADGDLGFYGNPYRDQQLLSALFA